MSNTHTPHIKASPEDFAKTVLMPGDPLRSKFIAENFLENARLINDARGIQGYTGLYQGTRVSVMASGMGIPSVGIYSYELFSFFGVENIIRVGSIGALQDNIRVRDLIIAMGASTNSSFGEQYSLGGSFAPIADYALMRAAIEESEKIGARYHVGSVLSSDTFYNANPDYLGNWRNMGILGIEMEAAGLYMNAARLGKRALAICTVSDHIISGEQLSADEREKSFTDMMEIALGVAVRMDKR